MVLGLFVAEFPGEHVQFVGVRLVKAVFNLRPCLLVDIGIVVSFLEEGVTYGPLGRSTSVFFS